MLCCTIEWLKRIRVLFIKQDHCRPPEGGRLYDMKVVSGYAFLRTYYACKKITTNHAAAISHKHRCEAALEKLDCLRKSGDSRVSGCTLDANIKESRLFRFWIIQIYFSDSGRFLCKCILRGINTSYFIFCFNSW